MIIAGVSVTGRKLRDLAMTVAEPDVTIFELDGTPTVPGDDLPGFIAREIGLNPANLADDQTTSINAFIAANTL